MNKSTVNTLKACAQRARSMLEQREASQQSAYHCFIQLCAERFLELKGLPRCDVPFVQSSPPASQDLPATHPVRQLLSNSLTAANYRQAETLGWLHQFYLTPKKTPSDRLAPTLDPTQVPAATQLFTPRWIVGYLVENTLGRLWLLNHPRSKLRQQMPYYVSAPTADDFPRIARPEEIRFCDPACGAGHILSYAFDLLCLIYREQRYPAGDIPALILRHNLVGLDLDPQAGQLATLILSLKAVELAPSFFRHPTPLQLCTFASTADDALPTLRQNGHASWPALQSIVVHMRQAQYYGALTRLPTSHRRICQMKDALAALCLPPAIQPAQQQLLHTLTQASLLAQRYHLLVTNPPYMGRKNMPHSLAQWAKEHYPHSKADLYAMFIERGLEMVRPQGYLGLVTMQGWMFLSTFRQLRQRMLTESTLVTMAQLGIKAFPQIDGAVVSTTAFVLKSGADDNRPAHYFRLTEEPDAQSKKTALLAAIRSRKSPQHYLAAAADLRHIPGSPIAYWLSPAIRQIFATSPPLGQVVDVRQGMATSDNATFLRLWWEVERSRIAFGVANPQQAQQSGARWFPYNKGGDFRKWYGNQSHLIDWQDDGAQLKARRPRAVIRNPDYYYRPSVSWSNVTHSKNAFRLYPQGFIFDSAGHSAFPSDRRQALQLLAFCNNVFCQHLTQMLNPTINFHVGYFKTLPAALPPVEAQRISAQAVDIAKQDWDACETSWDFTGHPLLSPEHRLPRLEDSYQRLRAHWQQQTQTMQQLEEENNRIFLRCHQLENQLAPQVSLSEITLSCNPHHRYPRAGSHRRAENLLRADTMRTLISYAVGCMFGRYALERPGLVSNQHDGPPYGRSHPRPFFPPVADNLIPLSSSGSSPDIHTLFCTFIRRAFGEQHYHANLRYLETALNLEGRRHYRLCDYFWHQFYPDHVKHYQRRPIYWLLSSGNGEKDFKLLFYLHRYRPHMLPLALKRYLLPHCQAHPCPALHRYLQDIFRPLAARPPVIDLDRGVVHNYQLFGDALAPLPQLGKN